MKRIAWTDQAKADIRSLDKPTAMRIPSALHRFAVSGAGDLKMLQGGIEELRLRTGDDAIEIRRVRHRSIGARLTVEASQGEYAGQATALGHPPHNLRY